MQQLRPLTPLCVVLLAAACFAPAALAQGTDQTAQNDPLATVTQANQTLAADIAGVREANGDARDQLRSDEKKLKAADITPARLEEARLDISSAAAQLDNIDTRLSARGDDVAALERAIDDARAGAGSTSAGNSEAAALATRKQLLGELQTLIDNLERLQTATTRQMRLAQRRLELLQQRFDLEQLRPPADVGGRRAGIQQAIDRHLREASALRGQLRGLSAETPAQAARKRLLDIRALDASERAELKAGELALLDRSRAVTQLAALSDNRAMPERALRKAREKMRQIADELASQQDSLGRKLEVIKEQQTIVQQRGAIAQGGDSTLDAQLSIVTDLGDEVAAQAQRVESLLGTAQRADDRFNAAVGRAARAQLAKRRSLPDDSRAWRELGDDLMTLPARVVANLWGAVQAVWQRLVTASPVQWLLLLALEGLLIGGIIYLRHFLDRTLIKKDLAKGAVLPMCALYWSLPPLIAPAALILLGWVLDVSALNLILLVTLLLIWPAVKFLLKMSFYLLVDEAPAESQAVRLRLHRELQWVLSLVGLIVGLSVVAHVVALSPGVVDVLERFSMICLLLVALPALHVRRVILARSDQELRKSGFWIRFAAALSLLAPVVLIGCAFIGLVGYVPLAWAISAHLGWLAVVTAGWLLAEAVLRDGSAWLSRRAQAKAGENADFWIQNIIAPAYKLAALGLLIVAALILIRIFGWSSETPIIRLIPQFLGAELFTVGTTTLHVRELVLAVLVVMLVFWMGSWSKQVSYKFAYARIGDYGIRQSLATFTQYAVVVLGLYIALKTIGLDLTALTVFAGALGVGIGFGLQNITSNFISGILLLIERPLRVSDIVNVEGIDGTVTHIGIRALKVRTFEQQEVVVPNSSVITKPFTNWTGGDDIYRTRFYVRISYDTDPHQAIDIITKIVNAQAGVVSTPAPKIVLDDFTESCMLIRAQYFTHVLGKVGLLDARSQILFAIWDAFRDAGIRIPFPQQDVHVKQLPPGDASRGGLGES